MRVCSCPSGGHSDLRLEASGEFLQKAAHPGQEQVGSLVPVVARGRDVCVERGLAAPREFFQASVRLGRLAMAAVMAARSTRKVLTGVSAVAVAA